MAADAAYVRGTMYDVRFGKFPRVAREFRGADAKGCDETMRGIGSKAAGTARRRLCTIYEDDLEVSAPGFALALQTLHRPSHKLRRYRRDFRIIHVVMMH